jgi:hypothetical protein
MQLDARQALILVFSFGALFLGILILYVAVRIHRKVSDLHSNAIEGVPAADASLIRGDIAAMRTHMASNHDEIDGELRPLVADTNWLATMFDRFLKFESDKPPRPEKRQKPIPTLVSVKKDPPS